MSGTLVVRGNESIGKHVEILDLSTGMTLEHKVFKGRRSEPWRKAETGGVS